MSEQLPPLKTTSGRWGYVAVPVALLYPEMFGGWLPKAVARTGQKLWGLGWRHRYERSDPWRPEDLLNVLGLGKTQMYEHLRILTAKRVLRYSTADGRFFFFYESPERFKIPVFRTDAGNSGGVGKQASQHHHYSRIPGGECEGGAAGSGFPDQEALDVLARMGVREPTRSELAVTCSVDELEAWADWLEAQDEVGVGSVILQIRAGEQAPALTMEQRARLEIRRRVRELGV